MQLVWDLYLVLQLGMEKMQELPKRAEPTKQVKQRRNQQHTDRQRRSFHREQWVRVQVVPLSNQVSCLDINYCTPPIRTSWFMIPFFPSITDGSMSSSSRPKQAPSKQAPRSCAKQLKCNFCLKQRGADADYAFDCGHLACKDCYNEKETCLWCKGPPAGRRSIRLPKGKDQKCNQLGCETTIGAIMVPCMCVSWCLSCADFIRNESHRKICLKCPR